MAGCFSPFCLNAPACRISFPPPLTISIRSPRPRARDLLILRRPHRRSATAATASAPNNAWPFVCTTTAFQGATVPNTWRYEFVIHSRKGKNVTGVPVPVPDSRPLPPPFNVVHSTLCEEPLLARSVHLSDRGCAGNLPLVPSF